MSTSFTPLSSTMNINLSENPNKFIFKRYPEFNHHSPPLLPSPQAASPSLTRMMIIIHHFPYLQLCSPSLPCSLKQPKGLPKMQWLCTSLVNTLQWLSISLTVKSKSFTFNSKTLKDPIIISPTSSPPGSLCSDLFCCLPHRRHAPAFGLFIN